MMADMDVSKKKGTPKWMVKIMENPIKMDDLGEKPLFLETSRRTIPSIIPCMPAVHLGSPMKPHLSHEKNPPTFHWILVV